MSSKCVPPCSEDPFSSSAHRFLQPVLSPYSHLSLVRSSIRKASRRCFRVDWPCPASAPRLGLPSASAVRLDLEVFTPGGRRTDAPPNRVDVTSSHGRVAAQVVSKSRCRTPSFRVAVSASPRSVRAAGRRLRVVGHVCSPLLGWSLTEERNTRRRASRAGSRTRSRQPKTNTAMRVDHQLPSLYHLATSR